MYSMSVPIDSQSFSERDDGHLFDNDLQPNEISPLNPASSPFKPIRDMTTQDQQRSWTASGGENFGAAPSAFPVLSDADMIRTDGSLPNNETHDKSMQHQQQQRGLSWMRSPSSFSSYSPFTSPNPSPYTLPPGHPQQAGSNFDLLVKPGNNNNSSSPRLDVYASAMSNPYASGYEMMPGVGGGSHTRESSPRTDTERKSPLSPLYHGAPQSYGGPREQLPRQGDYGSPLGRDMQRPFTPQGYPPLRPDMHSPVNQHDMHMSFSAGLQTPMRPPMSPTSLHQQGDAYPSMYQLQQQQGQTCLPQQQRGQNGGGFPGPSPNRNHYSDSASPGLDYIGAGNDRWSPSHNGVPNGYASQQAPQKQYKGNGYLYQVQFKRMHRCFILGPTAPSTIKPGEFVIVEADRGEDLGVVVSMAPMHSPAAAAMTTSCIDASEKGPDGHTYFKRIIRLAADHERQQLPLKWQHENEVLELCQIRSREMYMLPMSVVDAEYQFDRHKLIIFYSANRRIDFRELVRDLFTVFKTRIWMEHVTPAHMAFRPSLTAAKALVTGVLATAPSVSPTPNCDYQVSNPNTPYATTNNQFNQQQSAHMQSISPNFDLSMQSHRNESPHSSSLHAQMQQLSLDAANSDTAAGWNNNRDGSPIPNSQLYHPQGHGFDGFEAFGPAKAYADEQNDYPSSPHRQEAIMQQQQQSMPALLEIHNGYRQNERGVGGGDFSFPNHHPSMYQQPSEVSPFCSPRDDELPEGVLLPFLAEE